jgi:phosphoglycerol transferase MdoB-like AlkP superfamily enzyme
VEQVGPLGYHVWDAAGFVRARYLPAPLSDEQFDSVREWFARRASQRTGIGPWFGTARGNNLLIVQVESLQGFVLGLQIDGQEITPNLNRWRSDGLWLSHVTDQTNEGRTSDGEFASLVSLLPLEHGAVAFRYPLNHYVGLPRVLRDHGYTTLSAVPFASTFWNRHVTHRAYGFERTLFADAFGPGEQIGWGLNDRDFLQQLAAHLVRLPRPFCAYAITLSLHYPFSVFPDHLKTLKAGSWENTPFGNYLHAMHFADAALGEFRTRLQREGLLDATILMVMGDHDAGFAWDGRIARTIGIQQHVLDWSLADTVPVVMVMPPGEGPRGEIRRQAGQTDLAPTLLGVLGFDASVLPYVGRNLLGAPDDSPVVRRYGDWLDSRHFLVTPIPSQNSRTCFDLATGRREPLDVCRNNSLQALREVAVSHSVLAYDLQERLARIAGAVD